MELTSRPAHNAALLATRAASLRFEYAQPSFTTPGRIAYDAEHLADLNRQVRAHSYLITEEQRLETDNLLKPYGLHIYADNRVGVHILEN